MYMLQKSCQWNICLMLLTNSLGLALQKKKKDNLEKSDWHHELLILCQEI